MSPRIFLMPFSGGDDEGSAFITALNLVKEYKAHLDVWHVTPDPLSLVPGEAVDSNMIAFSEDVKAAYAEGNLENRRRYLKIIQAHGVPDIGTPPLPDIPSASFYTASGDAGHVIGVRGRLADLIVIGRSAKQENTLIDRTIHGALFDSARPVLLVPPGTEPKSPSNNILIAWNGSMEAARTVAFALPYLKGKTVRVITQQMEGAEVPELLPSDLAHYLKRHGIDAQSGACWNKDMTLPDCIIDAALFDRSDMIVMGAYSHNRIREAIFGGVTDYMLKHAELPVFMVR
jgi:nucleotide-binding universal stress UspA family protein